MIDKINIHKKYIILGLLVFFIIFYIFFYKKKKYHIQIKNAKHFEKISKNNILSRQSIHNYSVSFWIYINDWQYLSHIDKHILTHGSLELKYNDCYPSIYLTKNINNMKFCISTTEGLQSFTVKDIPIKKWCHIYLYVNKDSISVYLDGELDLVSTFKGYSILHNKDLYINANGGFDGEIANIKLDFNDFNSKNVKHEYSNKPVQKKNYINSILNWLNTELWIFKKKPQKLGARDVDGICI